MFFTYLRLISYLYHSNTEADTGTHTGTHTLTSTHIDINTQTLKHKQNHITHQADPHTDDILISFLWVKCVI